LLFFAVSIPQFLFRSFYSAAAIPMFRMFRGGGYEPGCV